MPASFLQQSAELGRDLWYTGYVTGFDERMETYANSHNDI